ncbi:MAG: cysteine desulfurase family protein [Planctomycetota bacterium]
MIINLDHNATTPIHPEVAQALSECYLQGYGNAASSHQYGRRARQVLEEARESVGSILGADTTGEHADRILFTSGGTEANNLALLGIAGKPPGRVIVSSVEHSSVAGAAEQLQRRGFDVQWLRVNGSGMVDQAHFDELLTPDTRVVSVMLANNETGVLQPIERLAEKCNRLGVPIHTDAVQAVGKIPVHFRALSVTALTLTAHKFHGPRGIGALILKRQQPLNPLFFGGTQQLGLRPGTEPIELAVGLAWALRCWQRDAQTRSIRMAALRDRLEELLRGAQIGAIVNGAGVARLPHTTNVAFPGLDCQATHMALDLAGIACSVGSACASGGHAPSPVLMAMHLPSEIIESSLRFSLGSFTTRQDIDIAAHRIIEAVERLHRNRQARTSQTHHAT